MTLYSKFKLAMIKINTKKPTIKLTPSKHFVFNLLGFPFLLFISFLCNENITWNKCDRIISKFCWYTEYLVLIWPWVIPFCSNLAGLTDIRVLPPGRNDVPSNNCTAKATDGSWIVEKGKACKNKCIAIPNNLRSSTTRYLEICHQGITLFPASFLVSIDLHPRLFSLWIL